MPEIRKRQTVPTELQRAALLEFRKRLRADPKRFNDRQIRVEKILSERWGIPVNEPISMEKEQALAGQKLAKGITGLIDEEASGKLQMMGSLAQKPLLPATKLLPTEEEIAKKYAEAPVSRKLAGTELGIGKFIEGLSTPENLALVLALKKAPPALQQMASGTFAWLMSSALPDLWKAFKAAPTDVEKAEIATEGALTLATAGLAGKHAVKGQKIAVPTVAKTRPVSIAKPAGREPPPPPSGNGGTPSVGAERLSEEALQFPEFAPAIGSKVKLRGVKNITTITGREGNKLILESPNGKLRFKTTADKIELVSSPKTIPETPATSDVAKKTEGVEKERLVEARQKKPLYELTPVEVDAEIQRIGYAESVVLEDLFGKAGAKKYLALERRANYAHDPKVADQAFAQMEAMEKKLSKAQQQRLYQGGEDAYTLEELKALRRVLGSLDFDSPEDLGRSLKYAVTKTGTKTDPAQMAPGELTYFTALRYGLNEAAKRGWDPRRVLGVAVEESAKRFASQEEAAFMLERFLTPQR